jgi:RNA polymerase sigma-70 factor (ECF subfamily)
MSAQSTTPRHDDADLVAHVLAGQPDAYAGLVRKHQQLVYRHMRGMGIDHDASLDLVQDAFVKAYTRLCECREPAHFRAWVFRIGRNLCLDYLKNVRRLSVPFSALPDAEQLPAPDDGDPELGSTLGKALQSLSLEMREAFLLKHDAGYTYEEVAEMTNTSPSAVKMRVHRAREALRDFLAQHGVRAA